MTEARPTILVADDSVSNVRLIQAMLNRAGYSDVVSATDSAEVLQLFQAVHPDLVLLDLHMPGCDGFELMPKLRAELAPMEFLPIVIMTGDISRPTRERALEQGANDFLTKPVDRTEVVLRVRNLLHTRGLNQRLSHYSRRLQGEIDEARQERHLAESEQALVRQRIEGVLEGRGMEIHFQPIVDLRSGEVAGLEGLARFNASPRRPPDQWFIEAARVGLGRELELAAVGLALDQLSMLPRETFVGINVSPETLCSPQLMAALEGREFARIVVEVTERARVEDYGILEEVHRRLRNRGVRVAVDDTGAGISSLQHVIRIRPDVIKLDRSMIADLDRDPVRRALTGALVEVASDLHAVIVAEGVETKPELATLRALKVGYAQGFLLGRPGPLPSSNVPLAEVEAKVAAALV